MVWKAEDPEGNETRKIRWECVPYARGRLLDVGCGEEKVFPSALGVDNCKDNLLFGAQIKPDFLCDTAERLPEFADASFDAVYSSHTLEHIEDYQAALAEWWRLLKPGGHLILYLPAANLYPNRGEKGANPDHKHDFRREHIVETMREVGHWDLLRNEDRNGGREYSFFQVYRKRTDGQWSEPWADPVPEKTLGIVRLGAYGDALWLTSVLPHLRAQGYHITVYTQSQGETILKSDPHVDRMICMPEEMFVGFNLVDYFQHEMPKYSRFINLVGSIETRLLPTAKDFEFYYPLPTRRKLMDRNYLQEVHAWCDLHFEVDETTGKVVSGVAPRVRFTPTTEEMIRAGERRAAMTGHVVVLNPAGSGRFKWYPHAPALARLIADAGHQVVVMGDLPKRAEYEGHDRISCVFKDWPIRDAMAFALLADVVIGPESAIVNAVSFEPLLKCVLLSHSSMRNLTRDWPETVSFAVQGLDCHPCHRIHFDTSHCTLDETTRAAACQAAITPEQIAQTVFEYLSWLDGQAKAAA